MDYNFSKLYCSACLCISLSLILIPVHGASDGACPKAKLYGPKCEYINHIFEDSFYTLDNTLWEKGSTCNSLTSQQKTVTFKFNLPIPVYWIRVVVRNESSPSDLSFELKSVSNRTISRQHEKKYVTGKVVDITFDLVENVSFVTLEASVYSVCHIYISMGKHIAQNHKELASMTDDPQNCVDNDINTFCTAKGISEQILWRLEIPDPAYIFRYRIKTNEPYRQKAIGNTVTFIDENENVIWAHKDTRKQGQKYYTGKVSLKNVRKFEISFQNLNPGSSSIAMSLAEVWLLGDYVCKGPFYGKRCDKLCNCADNYERCFPVTGSCSSGCKPGFQGMDCMDRCGSFTFGLRCASRCQGCMDVCDSMTGKCTECKTGLHGPWCNETCPLGTYGSECKPCPEKCGKLCDVQTGHCNGNCAPGWQGEKCLKHCSDFFWGRKCAKQCSSNCGGGGNCNHVNGHCNEGCNEKAGGPLCDESETPLFVEIASIIALVISFLVCTVLFIKKRRKPPKEQEKKSESSSGESTET